MSTEQFPTVPLATVNGTGPYAVPFSFTNPAHVALRVINADGTTSAVATNLWTLTPTGAVAGGWTGGNITLTTAGATALFGRQIYPERLSNVEQGWTPLPNPREGALSNQLDWLTRGIQEAAHGLSRSLRGTTALNPFVAVPERVLAFNASGQPVAGPRITDIENAAVNAGIVAGAGPVVAEMAALARRGLAARTSLEAILISDTQVLYYDPDMPEGQRFSQPEIQDALFRRMKARFPLAEAMFHCGDVVDRPDIGPAMKDILDEIEPGNTYQVGDEYPAGPRRFIRSLQQAGWDISRFFHNDGNHEFGFGLGKSRFAWTSERMREYFGEANYTVSTGNLTFINLSDGGGGTGGQMPAQVLDWADEVMSRPSGPTKHWFHLKIHQPPIGYGPSPEHTLLPPVVATAGQTVVEIGPFSAASDDALQVFLGPYSPEATPLVYGTDYTVNVTLDTDNQPVLPYTTITMTSPLSAGQIVQARIVEIDAYQDHETTERLLALCDKHRDKLKAVFYGHRGQLWRADRANVQQHPTFGTWFINNNMALNNAGLPGGLHPVTNPAIYTHLTWQIDPDTGAGTLTGRRWNDTAQDWLSNTHPDADHTFTITYDLLDLGRIGEWHDSRYLARGNPPTRQTRFRFWDVSELRVPVEGENPWPADRIGAIVTDDWSLEDKHLSNVNAGIELVRNYRVPMGTNSEIGGRVAWVNGPSRLVMQEVLRVANGSDSANTFQKIVKARTPTSDDWLELLNVDPLRALIDAPHGIAMRFLENSDDLHDLRIPPVGADTARQVIIPFCWGEHAPRNSPGWVAAVPEIPGVQAAVPEVPGEPYCQGLLLQRGTGSATMLVFQSGQGGTDAWFASYTLGAWTAWRRLLTSVDLVSSLTDTTAARIPTTGWLGLGAVNENRGTFYTALALPSLIDADYTAGVRYLLLGRNDNDNFKMGGQISGGRAINSSTHRNHAAFDISTHKGAGGTRATTVLLRHTNDVTTRQVQLKKVTYGGEAWIALELSGSSTIPAFRSGIYFTGFASGIEAQWVNAADVSGVTDPDFDNLFFQINNSEIYRRANVVGAVSQASGVPTGALIESGSNANGRYVRYAGGTQICWGTVTVTPVANTPTSAAVTFAAAFASDAAADLAITVSPITGVPGTQVQGVSVNNASTTGFDAVVTRTNTTGTVVRYTALGRWF